MKRYYLVRAYKSGASVSYTGGMVQETDSVIEASLNANLRNHAEQLDPRNPPPFVDLLTMPWYVKDTQTRWGETSILGLPKDVADL